MVLFCTDLDQTLIYSYKHEIGDRKRCVEIYQGREVSYMTDATLRLLTELQKDACIVPVTTRTVEQYERITLGTGKIRYALVCNGGVLLKDGKKDPAWYQQSLELVKDARHTLAQAAAYLETEAGRTLDVRLIEGLFVFTKCRCPQDVVKRLKQKLRLPDVNIFCNGEKVYVVPKILNKGAAIARLREQVRADAVLAAGDSAFDLPMLTAADFAAAPAQCGWKGLPCHVQVMPGKKVFSEELLEAMQRYLLHIL